MWFSKLSLAQKMTLATTPTILACLHSHEVSLFPYTRLTGEFSEMG